VQCRSAASSEAARFNHLQRSVTKVWVTFLAWGYIKCCVGCGLIYQHMCAAVRQVKQVQRVKSEELEQVRRGGGLWSTLFISNVKQLWGVIDVQYGTRQLRRERKGSEKPMSNRPAEIHNKGRTDAINRPSQKRNWLVKSRRILRNTPPRAIAAALRSLLCSPFRLWWATAPCSHSPHPSTAAAAARPSRPAAPRPTTRAAASCRPPP
jgi:hypothetical protein